MGFTSTTGTTSTTSTTGTTSISGSTSTTAGTSAGCFNRFATIPAKGRQGCSQYATHRAPRDSHASFT